MKVSFNRMALLGFVVLSGVGLLGSQALSGPARGKAPQAKATDPHLRALLRQKRNLLARIEQDCETQYRAGAATPEKVEQAAIAVIQADLDLATTRKERVTLRQAWLDRADKIEKMVERRYKAAVSPRTEWQEAQLARVEAEIALEREKNSK